MSEKEVVTLYFMSPRYCHTALTKALRKLSANEITDRLSKLCDDYWRYYVDMHDHQKTLNSQIQSWFQFQAVRKLLSEYGWWNDEKHFPIDWTKEENYR